VMASAPIAVMLYDRAFRFSSWKEAWRSSNARPLFYAALILTLIPLALSIAGGARTDTVGFNLGLRWYEYLYSQGWAIMHHLALAPVLIALVVGAEWVRRRLAQGGGRPDQRLLGVVLAAVGVVYLFASRWTALQIAHVSSSVSTAQLVAIAVQIVLAAGAVGV